MPTSLLDLRVQDVTEVRWEDALLMADEPDRPKDCEPRCGGWCECGGDCAASDVCRG